MITLVYFKDLDSAASLYRDTLGLEATMDVDWVKNFQVSDTSSARFVQDGKGFHQAADDKPAMLSLVTTMSMRVTSGSWMPT